MVIFESFFLELFKIIHDNFYINYFISRKIVWTDRDVDDSQFILMRYTLFRTRLWSDSVKMQVKEIWSDSVKMQVKEIRVRNRVPLWLVCVKFWNGAIKNAFKINIFVKKIMFYDDK